MDFKANIPIYLQVIQDIKHRIITGVLPLGGKLPSSRELALMYEINPNTAARVYNELEAAGISYTKRGIGTFITEDFTLKERLRREMLDSIMGGFVEQMTSFGYSDDEIIKQLQNYLSSA